ncbi:MAG: hypothetical protein ABW049_11720 [Spongiibacteraceae bacterium]
MTSMSLSAAFFSIGGTKLIEIEMLLVAFCVIRRGQSLSFTVNYFVGIRHCAARPETGNCQSTSTAGRMAPMWRAASGIHGQTMYLPFALYS